MVFIGVSWGPKNQPHLCTGCPKMLIRGGKTKFFGKNLSFNVRGGRQKNVSLTFFYIFIFLAVYTFAAYGQFVLVLLKNSFIILIVFI